MLDVDAGTTGAVEFNDAVTLNDLTLTDAASVVMTGDVSLNDLVTAAEDYTVSMTGGTNTFVAGVDFANSGLVTLGDGGGDTFAFDGGLGFSGGSAIEMGAAITTDGDSINFGDGGVTLIADSTVDSTDGGAAGADLTFTGTLTGGAFNLGLTAGTGEIVFAGVDALGEIAINNLTLTSGVLADIAGNININDLIVTGDVASVTMTGESNTFAQNVGFDAATDIVLGDNAGENTFAFNGGLTLAGGTASVGADIGLQR